MLIHVTQGKKLSIYIYKLYDKSNQKKEEDQQYNTKKETKDTSKQEQQCFFTIHFPNFLKCVFFLLFLV